MRVTGAVQPVWEVAVWRASAGEAERHAGQLARAHALRGADAVHLASALAVGDPGLIIAVWDRRLYAGARAAGCRVAPNQLS